MKTKAFCDWLTERENAAALCCGLFPLLGGGIGGFNTTGCGRREETGTGRGRGSDTGTGIGREVGLTGMFTLGGKA